MVRGARALTLDTRVGGRVATGAGGRLEPRWTPMNDRDRAGPTGIALDADERSGPRWTDDAWLSRRRHGGGGVTRRLRSARQGHDLKEA